MRAILMTRIPLHWTIHCRCLLCPLPMRFGSIYLRAPSNTYAFTQSLSEVGSKPLHDVSVLTLVRIDGLGIDRELSFGITYVLCTEEND